MAIFYSYVGLALAFIIITTLLLFALIKSNLHILLKVLIIPLVVWYSFVLYYAPNKLLGWPTTEEWIDGSVVEHYKIIEPLGDNSGGFYFWLYPPPEKQKTVYNKIIDRLNPRVTFSVKISRDIPRIFYMPYDREFHEMLEKKSKEKKKLKGRLMRLFRKPKEGNPRISEDDDRKADLSKYKIKIEKKSDLLIKPTE